MQLGIFAPILIDLFHIIRAGQCSHVKLVIAAGAFFFRVFRGYNSLGLEGAGGELRRGGIAKGRIAIRHFPAGWARRKVASMIPFRSEGGQRRAS